MLLIILYRALHFERGNKIIFRNITYESRSYIIFHESDIHESHGNDLCAKYFCQSKEKEEKESPFVWTHVLRMQISRSTYRKGHAYTAMYTRRKYKFGMVIESNFQPTNKICDQSNSFICFI